MWRIIMIVQKISNKRLVLSSIGTIGGRISNAGSQLLITGILARTLNANMFGFWALLYTIYSLMPNLDFGFGQALRLKLADLNARGGNAKLEERLFWNVSWILLILGVILGFIAGIVLLILPNIETQLRAPLFFFSLACGLTISFNLGAQIFYSYEEGFQRGILDISQAVLLALSVWIISGSNQLSHIIFIFYSIAIIFNGLALLWFIQKRQWKIQKLQFSDLQKTFNEIWRSSLWFWLLAVFASGISGTLPLFVASATNLEQVGHFVILQRLFSLLITLHYAWISTLQSAYTRSIARLEWDWAKHTWQRSSVITAIGMIGVSILMIWLHQPIIQLWTGKHVFDPILVIVLACLACILTWVNVNSVVLNGMGIIQAQVYWFFFSFIAYVVLNLILIPKIGVIGSPIATIIALLPIAILNYFLVKYRLTN
jgi:O-antigen/teichoic acid export membrane protein